MAIIKNSQPRPRQQVGSFINFTVFMYILLLKVLNIKQMKKCILIFLFFLGAVSSYAQTQFHNDTIQVAIEQWEYKTIYFHNSHINAKMGEIKFKNQDDILNEYGKQGWELLSVTPLVASNVLNGRVYTSDMCYTFKRKIVVKKQPKTL